MTPLCSKIALGMLGGINLSTARELVRRAGSPEAVFERSEAELKALLGRGASLAGAEYRLEVCERARREEVFVRENRIRTLYFADEDYPRRLLDCDDAPALLYAVGDTPLDELRTVAIVGTRRCSAYGQDFTSRLVADLAGLYGRVAIISGLAYGIDVAAHRAALREGLPTVAVMANGLNTVYPAEHRDTASRMVREGGMLLSEYPSSAKIHRGFFLARNRIVAGLADAVVVVESDMRGGAMATARIAAAYGRELFAAPGRVTDAGSRGCLDLIVRREASLIRSAEDIGDALGWTPRPSEGSQKEMVFELTPEQQAVVDHIRLNPQHSVNDMCVALARPFASLSSILFELEMADVVMTLPGGRYAVLEH